MLNISAKAFACAFVGALALSGGHALAQDTGSRLTKVVVPFPAGGTTDVVARLMAQQIGQATGQRWIIENRPGAGTIIGTDVVARSAPDGGTILMVSNSFVINGILRANLPYKPLADFAALCFLTDSPQVFVVNEASPFHTLKDVVDAAHARPDALSYAAVGPATTQHIAVEMFKQAAQMKITYVPYTGGAPAVNAILGGHVDLVMANYNEVMEHLSSGKLRALAVASRKRITPLPNVPTIAESGYPDFESSAFFGMVAPIKTPQEAVARINGLLKAALADPGIRSKLQAQGLELGGSCGAEFQAYIQRQHEKYTQAIHAANIKVE